LEIQREVGKDPAKGSLARCLSLTSGTSAEVARKLRELVTPFARFDSENLVCFPRGQDFPKEAILTEQNGLLTDSLRRKVTSWWLEVPERRTPSWDIAAKCLILGKPGLMLVEAKAHDHEFDLEGSHAKEPNRQRIAEAIFEANCWLNAKCPGWNLSVKSKYQLSNRFAWSWKLASMGVPVILLWLGFLNAEKMRDRGIPFGSPDEWLYAVLNYAKGVVPDDVWGRAIEVNGTPFLPLIRSLSVDL